MKQFVLFDWAAMPLPASARHCQATKKYKKIIPRNYIPASSTSAGRPARADLPPPFPNGISRRRWPSEMLFFRQSRESDANGGRSFNKTFVEIYYLKWGGGSAMSQQIHLHPAVPGSNPKHSIYSQFCTTFVFVLKRTKMNKIGAEIGPFKIFF